MSFIQVSENRVTQLVHRGWVVKRGLVAETYIASTQVNVQPHFKLGDCQSTRPTSAGQKITDSGTRDTTGVGNLIDAVQLSAGFNEIAEFESRDPNPLVCSVSAALTSRPFGVQINGSWHGWHALSLVTGIAIRIGIPNFEKEFDIKLNFPRMADTLGTTAVHETTIIASLHDYTQLTRTQKGDKNDPASPRFPHLRITTPLSRGHVYQA